MSTGPGQPVMPAPGPEASAGPRTQARERPRETPSGRAPRTRNRVVSAVARGLALFFGLFTLVSVAGALRVPAFDENAWWIDLRVVPAPAALFFLTVTGLALVAFAFVPRMRPWRRWATLALFALCAAATVWNGVDFYLRWRGGLIRPGIPFPLSFLLFVAFAFLVWAALRPPAVGRRRWPAALVMAGTAAVCAVLFPLAQVAFFGTTDYRRPADVVVVFGAQVHAGGAPSTSLRDRMNTAIALYDAGQVRRIFVSGGVGDSGYNEALVMRDMAVEAGVPAEKVAVDSNGVDTNATVADTVPFFGGDGWARVVVVSQGYHLPRIKLAYQRAGWDVLTVPAGTSTPIKQTPYLVAREIPAFWYYYLRAVAR